MSARCVGLSSGVFTGRNARHECPKVGLSGGLCRSGNVTQRPLGRDVERAGQVQPVGRCLSHTGRHEVGGGEEGGGAGGVTSSAAPGYLSQLVGHGLIILVVKASSLDPMRLKFQITFIHL